MLRQSLTANATHSLNDFEKHMVYRYVVTTYAKNLPTDRPIVMVDGTVPHWNKTDKDLHFDHHRPQGQPVQILEIPEQTQISIDACFVTTQVDADACAAAAWLQLLQMDLPERLLASAKQKLVAIAYDCDHLGLPQGDEFVGLDTFARDAVATLKQSSEKAISELGLPAKRNEWSVQQKLKYASDCFQGGTNWLVQAALGHTWWPGENGEAQAYWDNFDRQRESVHARCRLYRGVGVFDGRGVGQYVDPRHLIEWVRKQPDHLNVTLTVRDRHLELLYTEEGFALSQEGLTGTKLTVSAYSYTLGSVPLHDSGSPQFSDRDIWNKLSSKENEKRRLLGFPQPKTGWGGRNEVGGSSWNDAALLCPEEVIDIVLPLLTAN